MSRFLLLLAAAVLLAGAGGVRPDEMLKDPAQEARARALDKEFRCLVCRNQSIDDSDADLAQDLRRLVRERIAAGDSDQQVRDHLVARYGDFVLLDPPFKPETWLLWLAPPAVGLAGAGGLLLAIRRRRRAAPPPPLAADEAERLARLLDGKP